MRKTFADVQIGQAFELNGNSYVKTSTRTGRMLSINKVFYIGQKEVVHCESKIQSLDAFIRAAESGRDIYDLFEFCTDEATKDEIYSFADVDSPEPFRSACYSIGYEFDCTALKNY